MRPWVRQNGRRAGRSAHRRRRAGDLWPFLDRQLRAGLGELVTQHPEAAGTSRAVRRRRGRSGAATGRSPAPVRDHEHLMMSRIVFQRRVEGVDHVHDGMLPRTRVARPTTRVASLLRGAAARLPTGRRSWSSRSPGAAAPPAAAGGSRPTGPTAAPDRVDRAAIARPRSVRRSPGPTCASRGRR